MTGIILSLLYTFCIPLEKKRILDVRWERCETHCNPTAEPETRRREQSMKCKLQMPHWPTCCMHAWFSNRLPPLDDSGKRQIRANHTVQSCWHSTLGCAVFVLWPFHIGWFQNSRIIPPQTERTAASKEAATPPPSWKFNLPLRPENIKLLSGHPLSQASLVTLPSHQQHPSRINPPRKTPTNSLWITHRNSDTAHSLCVQCVCVCMCVSLTALTPSGETRWHIVSHHSIKKTI